MARPQVAALHDDPTSPRAVHFSPRGAAALLSSALTPSSACPLGAAEEGRAVPSSMPDPDRPARRPEAGPVPVAAPTESRTGAKRGPKPARGRLIVLPAQFFPNPQRTSKMPERRLMLAILTDAIECFQKYNDARQPRHRALFTDARRWFLTRDSNERSDPDARKRFSFEYVCDVLDLEPEAIRDRLRRWEKRSGPSAEA